MKWCTGVFIEIPLGPSSSDEKVKKEEQPV